LHAGRREFHTYDAVPAGSLIAHLRAPERPAALEDLFLLADGYRVACRLAASYPGVAADLRWAAARLLATWTEADLASPAAPPDALWAVAVLGDPPERVPAVLRAAVGVVLPALQPLALAEATAADALAVAERLSTLFDIPSDRSPAAELL